MQEKFEKNIEAQLSGFQLEPSPQVWQQVEAALDDHYKKRPIAWWWFLFAGFLLIGSITWLWTIKPVTEKKPAQQTGKVEKNKTANTKEIPNTNNEDKNISAAETVTNNNSIHLQARDKQTALKEIVITKNPGEKIEKVTHSIFSVDTSPATNSITTRQTKKADTTLPAGFTTFNTNSNPAGSITLKNNGDTIVPGNNINNLVEYQKNPGTGLTKETKTINNKSDTNKPRHWYATFGLGTVNTSNQFFGNWGGLKNLNYSLPGAFTGGTVNQAAADSNKMYSPQAGITIQLGISYEKGFSNRWSWFTGLQYRYLQNSQPTGIPKDSLSIGGNYSGLYYKPGNRQNIINHAHWLELPAGLNYNINPKAKTKIIISAGVSIAWMFADKWLINDEINRKYYYHSPFNNHFIVNAMLGASADFKNKFQLGIHLQQSMLAVNKLNQSKLYWSMVSLQFSKPLPLSNKKKKERKP